MRRRQGKQESVSLNRSGGAGGSDSVSDKTTTVIAAEHATIGAIEGVCPKQSGVETTALSLAIHHPRSQHQRQHDRFIASGLLVAADWDII
jgi:hypothetical protein